MHRRNKHLFLTSEKSKIKAPANSMSGKSLLPGLQMVTFLLYPHRVEKGHLSHVFYKGTNTIPEGFTFIT